MNYLESLTCINAATLPYAHVQIDGNTLLSGKNGAGKTTILRAVLYFYGVHKSADLGIIRGKKAPFDEYYFRRSNSYLVYRYTNEYGKVIAIAYKTQRSRVRFRFAIEPSETNFETLFFEEHQALEPNELFKRLKEHGYEFSSVISSSEIYRKVLYGQEKSYEQFHFFKASSEYEQIAKTLSKIFVNSKLDSGSIKRSLVSSIDGFSSIDLEQIRRSIDAFSMQYKDIMRFTKNQRLVEECVKLSTQHSEIEETIHRSMVRIALNAEQSLAKKELLYTQKEDIEHALAKEEEQFKHAQAELDEQKATLKTEIIRLETKLETSKSKKEYFANKSIEKIIVEYESLPLLEKRLEQEKENYATLTQEQESVKEKFTRLREQQKYALEQNRLQLQQALNEHIETFNQEQERLLEQKSHYEVESETLLNRELEPLLEELNVARHAIESANNSLFQVQNSLYFSNEIESEKELLSLAQRSLDQSENSVKNSVEKINTNATKVSAIEERLAFRLEHNNERHRARLQLFEEQRRLIKNRLGAKEGTFLHFLNESSSPHKVLLSALIKDEVLQSSELDPVIVDDETTTIMGIKIDIDAIDVTPYGVAHINKALEDLDKEQKGIEKSFLSSMTREQEEVEQELNRLLKERKNLENAKLEFEKDKERLRLEVLQKEERLRALQNRASQFKEEQRQKSEKALAKALTDTKKAQDAYDDLKNRLQEEKHHNDAHFLQEHARIQASKNEVLQRHRERIDVLNKAFLDEQKSLELQENESFKGNGVDTHYIEKLQSTIRTIEKDINSVKAHRALIDEYYVYKKDYFDLESTLQERKRELETRLKAKEGLFSKEVEHFNANSSQLKQQRRECLGAISNVQNDLMSYERFTKEPLYEQLRDQLSDDLSEVSANENTLEELVTLIRNNSYEKESLFVNLRRRLKNFYNDFSENNIFSFTIPNSEDVKALLAGAKQIESFVENDKIETFKERVASQFSLVLKPITSTTTQLLDANDAIKAIIEKINVTLKDLQGIKVIRLVELRFQESSNAVLNSLKALIELNKGREFGNELNLFTLKDQGESNNKKILELLSVLSKQLEDENKERIYLDDTFVLEFRAIENSNDSGFVSSLDGVGSNGTDVMVKAMVNIAMLWLVKRSTLQADNVVNFHCILDEIGILHPDYLKELIEYANNKEVYFLNGAPDEKLVTTYKRLYILTTNSDNQTLVRRLVSKA